MKKREKFETLKHTHKKEGYIKMGTKIEAKLP